MGPIDEQDAADMARLAQGLDAALDALMERHRQPLFHYLLRQLQNESEAVDLAQETFVHLYQSRARYDPHQKFTTWLYAIATNLLRDRFRWGRRHPQVSLESNDESDASLLDHLPDAQPTPDQTLQSAERVDLVRKAVAALPEEFRTPLILSVYQGLSQLEIGAILHCTAKAVEMRVRRAREQLRQSLQKILPSL